MKLEKVTENGTARYALVLLSARRAMSKKGGMKVTNVSEMVRGVFDVTGLSEILDIE